MSETENSFFCDYNDNGSPLRNWIIEVSLALTANGMVHKKDHKIVKLEGNLRIKSSSISYFKSINLRVINRPTLGHTESYLQSGTISQSLSIHCYLQCNIMSLPSSHSDHYSFYSGLYKLP